MIRPFRNRNLSVYSRSTGGTRSGSKWAITLEFPTSDVPLVMQRVLQKTPFRSAQSESLRSPGNLSRSRKADGQTTFNEALNSSNSHIFDPPGPIRCIPHEAKTA